MADNQQNNQSWRPRGRGNNPRGRGNRGGNWSQNNNPRGSDVKPDPNAHKAPDQDLIQVSGENLPLSEIEKRLEDYEKLKLEKQEREKKDKKDTRILIHTTFALPDNLMKSFEQMYPSHRFVCDKPHAPVQDHPYVAIERQIAEESILHRFNSKEILNIYGNPGRMKKGKHDNVHCCIPPDEPIDCVSTFWADNVKDAKYCVHDPFTCACVKPDVFICMYRAQDWGPEDIVRMLKRTTDGVGIITIRHYNELVGSMCKGEITYTRDEERVTMQVTGDSKSYEMGDGAYWFMTSYYDDGTNAFAWEQIDRYGDTRVVLIKSAKTGLVTKTKPPTMGLLQSLRRPEFFGQLNYDLRAGLAKDPALYTVITTLKLEQAKAFSVYNWVLFHYQSEDKKIYVPKGVVDEVRVFVGLRPRDSALFASAAEKAKKSCIRFNIPTEMIAESATAAAILGFFNDVETEKQLLMPILDEQHRPIKDLNALLTFLPKWFFPTKTVVKAALHLIPLAVALMTLAYTYWQRRKYRSKIEDLMTTNVTKAMFAPLRNLVGRLQWYLFCFGYQLTSVRSDAAQWARQTNINELLSGISTLLPWMRKQAAQIVHTSTRTLIRWSTFSVRTNSKACIMHRPITRIDVCMEGHPLPPIDPSATVTLPINFSNCVPKHGTTQFGFGVNMRIPVVARSCVHNEQVAVVSRGCLARPESQVEAWDEMFSTLNRILPVTESAYVRNGRLKRPDFNFWVNRFPPKRRAELQQAKSSLANGEQWVDLVVAFVKREKQLKSYPESTNSQHIGVELFAPRIISGRKPLFQVVTGPITYSMTKQIAWMWNQDVSYGVEMAPQERRPRTTIIYTSGMNAEQLGSCFEFHLARLSRLGAVMFKEEDQSRFDAHCGPEAVRLILHPYKTHHAPANAIKPLARLANTKGVTQHGIKYKIAATVKSGDGNTSSGDTTVVGTAKEVQRERANIPPEEIITFNTGDDVLSIYLAKYNDVYTPIVDEHWISIGFNAKIHTFISQYDAEYCSGRFWPTKDGLIFGPKPGRILAKTFHSMIEYNEHMGKRWLLTVAKGLHRDTYFQPIVRTVIAITLKLMAGFKEIEVKEEEKIHALDYHEVCTETYLMYEHLYGLTKTMCDEVETFLTTEVVSLPCTVNHEFINRILEVDCPEEDLPRVSEVTKASIRNLIGDPYYLITGVCLAINPHGVASQPFLLTRNAFQEDIIMPIVEELLKQQSPILGLLIPAYELGVNLHSKMNGAALNPWPALAVHMVCHYMGRTKGALMARIAVHMLFNSALTHARASVAKATWVGLVPMVVLGVTYYLIKLGEASGSIWSITTRLWNKLMHALNGNMNNYKGELQTLCQKWGVQVPIYSADSSGSSHNPVHTVKCVVNGNGVTRSSTVSSTTMKAAEQGAAQKMLEYMVKNEGEFRASMRQPEATDENRALMVAMSHDFTYDSIYIDADNVKAPVPNHEPRFIAHETFFAGVCTSVTQWEAYIDHWSTHFGDVSEKIVESTPDAADNAMLRHMTNNIKKSMVLVTKDQKFIKLATQACAGSLTVVSTLQEVPAVSIQKMQLVLNVDTISILQKMFAKYSGMEDKPRVVQSMFKSFI